MLREKYIPNNTAIAIVDFDNVFGDYFNLENHGVFINKINKIISSIIENSSEIEYCLLRLYGGWYEDGHLTKRASEVMQRLGANKFFPIKIDNKTILRGEVELVGSLSAISDYNWNHTYVQRRGLPRLRLERNILDSHCSQVNSNCPARLLAKFTKSKRKQCVADGCTVVNHDAFVVGQQKMIDTLMATDIVDLSHRNDSILFEFVYTDDTDLLPPTLRAHTNNKVKVKIFVQNEQLRDKFRELKADYGFSFELIEY